MLPEEELGTLLRSRGLTLAIAESCTGGLVSDRVTDIPGSSDYFLAGLITYSDHSKRRFLNVRETSLMEYGAVSDQVAQEMAQGVRRTVGSDIGISTTGIAGPGGGTEEKPVGLVYLAVSDTNQTRSYKENFSGTRSVVKKAAAERAIEMTIEFLE